MRSCEPCEQTRSHAAAWSSRRPQTGPFALVPLHRLPQGEPALTRITLNACNQRCVPSLLSPWCPACQPAPLPPLLPLLLPLPPSSLCPPAVQRPSLLLAPSRQLASTSAWMGDPTLKNTWKGKFQRQRYEMAHPILRIRKKKKECLMKANICSSVYQTESAAQFVR